MSNTLNGFQLPSVIMGHLWEKEENLMLNIVNLDVALIKTIIFESFLNIE